MSSNARVEYRNLSVAESAEVSEASADDGGGVFVALDEPLPVRSVVRLVPSDGDAREVVVTRVVEVGGEGSARGLYARDASDEDRERAAKVGTEHLEGRASDADEGSAASDGSDGAGNMSMAMPAPVVVDTEEDEADLDAARRAAEARAAGESSAGEDASANEDGAGDESESEGESEGESGSESGSESGGESESGDSASSSQSRRKRGRGRGRRRR